MKKKFGFIYLTTNLINGKQYIGKKMYRIGWENYLGSGVHLTNAIKKYGRENFKREILEECKTEEDLQEAEIRWIMFYNAVEDDNFYNIAHGGDGTLSGELHPLFGKNHSKETRKKISEKAKLRTGEKNPFFGKTHSNEVKRKVGEAQIGRPKSVEERKSISERTKGKNNPMYGRKHTEEAKEINRLAHLGKSPSKEVREKMSKNNSKKRKIICLNTGEVFESIVKASKVKNVHLGTLYQHLCRYKQSCGKDENGNKMTWMYYDEYENSNLFGFYESK